MSKRTAILYGGSAYNIRFSLKSQLENLIIPNDADVFIVTTRFCKRRITFAGNIPDAAENDAWNEKNKDTIFDEEPLRDDEIQLIRDTFGDRVKCIHIVEEMPDYVAYLNSERLKMGNMVNWYVDESVHMKIPPPFGGGKFNHPLDPAANGTIRCVIDQYRHVKKCYEFMEQYENEHNFKYDWVMRARIDFIVPDVFNINHYAQNLDQPYLFVCGSFRRESFEWLDEFCFFSKRITAAKLYPELNRMGLIRDRKYQTLQYGTKYAPDGNDFMFDPEAQFSMLLHEIKLTQLIHVPIYRSACYTAGGDGYDYFNYKFRRDRINLDLEYQLVKNCETDINEHIPTLRKYAEQCDLVVEIGVRFANSTIGIMAGRPKRFISYDVFREEKIDYVELVAKESEVNWEFILQNPTPEDGSPSLLPDGIDMLFIDTNHYAQQMALELKLHSPKVKKWIILHDTEIFWNRGAGDDHLQDGLKNAVEPFLEAHKSEWRIKEKFTNNNGLMVLERINSY